MSQDSTQAQPSYEQARAELADVVQRLESGGVPLAESMKLWQRGEELAGICQGWLDGARATIEQARQDQQNGQQSDGDEAGTEPQTDPKASSGAAGR